MTARNLVVVEVLPDSDEVDLDAKLEEIKSKLPEWAVLSSAKKEPFVFGMHKLVLSIIIPEQEGLVDELERAINEVEGVSAEVKTITRLA